MTISIASQLKTDIEVFADRLRMTHPLLRLAQDGELSAEGVAGYLMNARFMVQQTPRHLKAAQRRALELGCVSLADFFAQKRREEVGHDAWADSDLSILASRFEIEAPTEPSRHLRNLVHLLDRVLGEEPSRYVPYILFAEYSMVLLGPVWLRALSGQCDIPAEALTIVSKHVELDDGHVADELRQLDILLIGSDPVVYLDVLHQSMRLFEYFCDELFEAHRPASDAEPVAAE